MRKTSDRLFGEPLRMKKEGIKKEDIFSLKVKENYMPGMDLSFVDSEKAKLLVEGNNILGFIDLIMDNKKLSFSDIMATEAETKDVVYQVNYVAVYFVLAGAVAAIVIDVVRDDKDVNIQKMKLRLANNEFSTALIASALEYGGLKFAQKVGKLYLGMVNNYYLENEDMDLNYAN